MGWSKRGKLLVPDGKTDVQVTKKEEDQVTPSGLIVRGDVDTEVKIPKQVQRLIKKMHKKQGKEANKAYLDDRYSYLRKSNPKKNHTSGN